MSARDAGRRAITLFGIRDAGCCALAPVRSKGSTGLQPSLFMPYLPLHWRLAVSSLSMSSLKQMTLSVNMRLLPDIETWRKVLRRERVQAPEPSDHCVFERKRKPQQQVFLQLTKDRPNKNKRYSAANAN